MIYKYVLVNSPTNPAYAKPLTQFMLCTCLLGQFLGVRLTISNMALLRIRA